MEKETARCDILADTMGCGYDVVLIENGRSTCVNPSILQLHLPWPPALLADLPASDDVGR